MFWFFLSEPKRDLSNHVAAITGAGSGIGRALALNLASRGCHLALCDRNQKGLDQTLKLLANHTVNTTQRCFDVADEVAMFSWANEVVRDHGRVHMIFNNAGVALAGTINGITLEQFRWHMGINFFGVLNGVKAFLPYLEQNSWGHIINISSFLGLTAIPLQSSYIASKFAVSGLTEGLRMDLDITQSPVSCSSVYPGGVNTNILRGDVMTSSVETITGTSSMETIEEYEKAVLTTSPEKAADTIVEGMLANKRRILVGRDMNFFDPIIRLSPSFFNWCAAKFFSHRFIDKSKKGNSQSR